MARKHAASRRRNRRRRRKRQPERIILKNCGYELINGEYLMTSPGCYTHHTAKDVTLTSGHNLSVFGAVYSKSWLIKSKEKKLYAAAGDRKTDPRDLVFDSIGHNLGANQHPPTEIVVAPPRILLVLDLDETLISTHYDYEVEADPDFTVSLGEECMGRVYKRPYVEDFLEFAFENFDVAVWTAAISEYAKVIVDNCFTEEQRQKLRFIWTREHCTSVEPAWNRGRIWDNFYIQRKLLRNIPGYQMNRILHVDNTFSTFSQNRRNGILVEDWNGFDWQNDQELLMLKEYLQEQYLVTPGRDVRSVPKRDWKCSVTAK